VDGDGNGFTLNLRFAGQQYDGETGFHYNYFRTYDPATGRYITSDPIGLEGGLNTYGYVGGNPINRIDPTGLVEWNASYAGGGFYIGFGAGVHHFTLVSDCINGKQAEASVLLIGSGIGIGIGYTVIPVSIEEQLIFKDPYSTPDPTVFNGMGGMLAVSAELAPASYGIKEITLGSAKYVAGTGEGATGGIGLGATMLSGSSTVLSSKITNCDCEK